MNQPKPISDILVRIAVVDEAPVIASILHQAFVNFKPHYTPAAFAATTPKSDQIQRRWSEGPVWVVLAGDRLVGTVSAVPQTEGLYIRSMAVLPSHHGQGVGYILLKTARDFAVTRSIRRLYLRTTPFLPGALRLYERFGFQRNSDTLDEFFGTPLFTMVKMLEITDQR